MLLSLAAIAAFNAASSAFIIPDDLPALFVAACLDGRANAAGATPIEFDALPSALRTRLGHPTTSKVWKLVGSEDAYLYSLTYTERGWGPNSCGVASEGLDLRPASAAVETRLRGGSSSGSYRPTEWFDEKVGYRALATRVGGFTVLQINTGSANQAGAPASR